MEVQFKLQVRDFVEWDVQRYHRPQKATVVDPYPSPPTASSRLRAAYERWLRVLQYCQLIIPHVILGVLRHGSSPRQPRLGWYDHRLYRQEVYLEQRRLRWLGHVSRMDQSRLPHQVLYGQLADGKRDRGRPKLRFVDVCRRDLKSFHIGAAWESLAMDRTSWRCQLQQEDPTNEDVRLNFVIYQSSRLFQSNQTASFLAGSKTRVNSRIIASRITHFELKNLSTPVVLRYLPIVQNSTNNTVNNIRCVFWDFTAAEGRGDWSTEGCDFVKMDNKRIVCNCSHLTNFAVLMDIYGPWHSFTLDIISKIGIALSTTGLAFTLISYLVFKQLRQTRPQHILMNLCIALLATLIIFLAGIDATNSPVGCTTVAFLLHYFLLAVFMWMAVEAFNMYLAFVKVLGAHVSRFLLKAAIFAWGLPFIVAIITLAVDVPSTYPDGKETYRSTSVCWLQGNQLYYGFLLPVGLVLLFNSVVYIMVITKLTCGGRTKGKVDDNNSGGTKQQLRIAIAVMVLVGLTWIFGFFMIRDGGVVFSYLFCIFNSLQGFFIFIFHCLRQKEVQNLWFK
ncbi:hypothetical protein Bbelb_200580 [Branchiostoma belcheri]|nr:hypothetical protein Bbelb_200580 [Branchiostoma belcheri]